MKKENVSGSVILKLNASDLLRIKIALNRSIRKERDLCKTLKLDDYEVICLQCLLLRVEMLERDFMDDGF